MLLTCRHDAAPGLQYPTNSSFVVLPPTTVTARCSLQLMAPTWHEAALLTVAHSLEVSNSLRARKWASAGGGYKGRAAVCEPLIDQFSVQGF